METRWVFFYRCPRFGCDHICWEVIEDEEKAHILARRYGLPWPAECAWSNGVHFTTVRDGNVAKVIAEYLERVSVRAQWSTFDIL